LQITSAAPLLPSYYRQTQEFMHRKYYVLVQKNISAIY